MRKDALMQLLMPVEDYNWRQAILLDIVCRKVAARGGGTPTVARGFADELLKRGDAASRHLVILGNKEILAQVLGEMGFTREGRYFALQDLEFLVECQGLEEGGPNELLTADEDLVENRKEKMLTWGQIERTARETRLKACRLGLEPVAKVRTKLRLLGKLCQASIDKYPLVHVGDRLVIKGY